MLAENDIFRRGARVFGGLVKKHPQAVTEWHSAGLFFHTDRNDYRGVIRHQLLVAAIVQTAGELMGMPEEELQMLVKQALTHDKDKRRQIEGKTRPEIIAEELQKKGIASATSTNFNEFPSWEIGEYLLRFADSSAALAIEPWRDRVAQLFKTKADENETGKQYYGGMGMWEKLQEVTTACEQEIHARIMALHPELAEKYPNPEDLHNLVSTRLKQKTDPNLTA